MSNNWIAPSEIGHDIIGMSKPNTGLEWTVGEWLNENENNLVIRYGTTNFLFNIDILTRQSKQPRASLVKCPDQYSEQTVRISDEPTTYMDLGLIAIPGVVVETIDVMDIIRKNHQVYEIIPASINVSTNAQKNTNGVFNFLTLMNPIKASNTPQYIRVVVQNDENMTENCNSAGKYFYNKIVKIELQKTNMSPGKPSLGGKRKNTKKRKSVKRKSAKKRKSVKK